MSRRRSLDLSDQQERVLELMARGRTNFEIAQDLDITLDGAKYHIRQVFDKLGVDSREDAVAAWNESRGSVFERVRGFLWPVGAIAVGGAAVIASVVIGALALSGAFKSEQSGGSIPAGVWVAMIKMTGPQSNVAHGTLEVFKAGDKQHAHVFKGTYAPLSAFGLQWSPDGRHLAVSKFEAGSISLAVLTRVGSNWTSLAVPLTPHSPPLFSWSPDSKMLAFQELLTNGNAITGIRVTLIDTSGKTLASIDVPGSGQSGSGQWSPSGALVAWPINGQVAVLTPAGAHIAQSEGAPDEIAKDVADPVPFPSAPKANASVKAALPEPSAVNFSPEGLTADGSGWVFAPMGGQFDGNHLIDDYKVAVQLRNGKVQPIDLGERYPSPAGSGSLHEGYAVVITK